MTGTAVADKLTEASRTLSTATRKTIKEHLGTVRSSCDDLETLMNTTDAGSGDTGEPGDGAAASEALKPVLDGWTTLREATVALADLVREAFSYDQQRDLLQQAIRADVVGAKKGMWVYVREQYDDHVIYNVTPDNGDGASTLYSRDYTIDSAGKVTLGEKPVKVVQATQYIVAESAPPVSVNLGGVTVTVREGTDPAEALRQITEAMPAALAKALGKDGGGDSKAPADPEKAAKRKAWMKDNPFKKVPAALAEADDVTDDALVADLEDFDEAGLGKGDFAHAPGDTKTDWKLPLTKTPGGAPHAGLVGAAAAALGPGFRGNKVSLPSDAVAGVKAKVRAAWKKLHPDKTADDMPDGIKESAEVVEAADLLLSDMVPLVEASAFRKDGTGSLKLIAPGWGTTGYYPASVLERDGPKVFTKGLKTFMDHPTEMEEKQRPERSLRDLVGELTSDATWQSDGAAGPGLYADAKVYGPFKEHLGEIAPSIGISIRALGRVQDGEAEGRKGKIVESIGVARSADYVTAGGAGGKVMALLEAARGGDAGSSGAVALTETEMNELEEARRELAAARAELATVRTELTAAQASADKLAKVETDLARFKERALLREAADLARVHLRTADMPEVTKERLIKQASLSPVLKDGELDEAAFITQLTESARAETAYIAAATDSGRVRGMGTPVGDVLDMPAAEANLGRALGRLGLSESARTKAVEGRV